ncbi:MAG: hypothetical protein JWP00_2140 [Chloroflexi bacterium]|jgi:hypothetical protein|nr:hypothetical protein [Chloroflexota bacterium]
MRGKPTEIILSDEDQQALKELEEAVSFGIETNRRALKDGQTLYLDSDLKISRPVAAAFIQTLKYAGWPHVRLYEDGAGKTVVELANPTFRSFIRQLFHF